MGDGYKHSMPNSSNPFTQICHWSSPARGCSCTTCPFRSRADGHFSLLGTSRCGMQAHQVSLDTVRQKNYQDTYESTNHILNVDSTLAI